MQPQEPINPTTPNETNQPSQYPQNVPVAYSNFQRGSTPQVQSKSHTKLIILGAVIVSLLVLLAIGGVVTFILLRSNDNGNSASTSMSNNTMLEELVGYKTVQGTGYRIKVPEDYVREDTSKAGKVTEQFLFDDLDRAMLIVVTVEANSFKSSFLANDAVTSKIRKFESEPNFRKIMSEEATVKWSEQGYVAEIVYGEDPSYYLLRSGVLADGTTTVTVHIAYPESMHSEARLTAEAILDSLEID